MGLFLTVFGFALIWHIWWLVGASLVAPSLSSFATLRDDQGYMVPAEEVARIEGERIKRWPKQVLCLPAHVSNRLTGVINVQSNTTALLMARPWARR
jgi:hypothetical protein